MAAALGTCCLEGDFSVHDGGSEDLLSWGNGPELFGRRGFCVLFDARAHDVQALALVRQTPHVQTIFTWGMLASR